MPGGVHACARRGHATDSEGWRKASGQGCSCRMGVLWLREEGVCVVGRASRPHADQIGACGVRCGVEGLDGAPPHALLRGLQPL